jgi:hypothetical protein
MHTGADTNADTDTDSVADTDTDTETETDTDTDTLTHTHTQTQTQTQAQTQTQTQTQAVEAGFTGKTSTSFYRVFATGLPAVWRMFECTNLVRISGMGWRCLSRDLCSHWGK